MMAGRRSRSAAATAGATRSRLARVRSSAAAVVAAVAALFIVCLQVGVAVVHAAGTCTSGATLDQLVVVVRAPPRGSARRHVM